MIWFEVQYEITEGTLTNQIIATATPTYYGWLAEWNTTTVANGSYTLQSLASFSGGGSATSAPVAVIVNAPPSTVVIIPANGATLDNTKGWVIDALASPGVTSVSIVATPTTFGLIPETFTATPTIYGWIVQESAFPPCAGCIPYYIPITIQSVTSYSGGVSGTSAPVSATNILYLPPDIASRLELGGVDTKSWPKPGSRGRTIYPS